MKKHIALTAVLLLLATLLFGCAAGDGATSTTTTATPTKTQVAIGTIQGPTGIGMVNLMEADAKGTAANDYTFTVGSTPQEIGTKLAQGALDMAALPTNLAASLYQKTSGKVKLLAVNTLGVLYILENGSGVQSIADLRGKTIYSTGEGANPEYILKYVLEKNGLTVGKDVNIEFIAENTELATRMASGDIKLAMVPEPQVSSITAQNADVRVALSMNTEWEAVAGENNKLMMGCVAVRAEFLEKNKAAVDAFLNEYKTSAAATAQVDATAALCETYGIIPKAAIAKKAIPNCQITFVAGADMKAQITAYYDVLFAANPTSIGGKLPENDFYYVG
ncbi:MAG: PhnD/SsuA/transferrin family substrate-binding protein [Clostridia bacterium]|nr:PhnD/SsuA/transferrin family substrate-binding protein [Clostridia bacterium]